MRVVVLGPYGSRLQPVLKRDAVGALEEPCTPDAILQLRPDILLSYGYRHLVSADVLRAVDHRAINLHVSALPWNRGADPNFWSWAEHTPKGVSIHWMTVEVDRGDLVAQRVLSLPNSLTLRSSYNQLQNNVVELLQEVWPSVCAGEAPRQPQEPGGTFHSSRDKDPHSAAMPCGWDTPCHVVESYGRDAGLWTV